MFVRVDGSGSTSPASSTCRSGSRCAARRRYAGVDSGLMQDTYDRAIQKNPALAKSDEHWVKMGDSWYDGLPASWPRDWVVP